MAKGCGCIEEGYRSVFAILKSLAQSRPQFLPYVSILPAFASLQLQAAALQPNRQLDAQRKIRHWYWASVFTNRYSGSVESTTSRDFLDLKAWFENDAAAPALLEEFRLRFRSLDLRKELKRGSSVYNGIFNLLVLRGARDWMTGNVPQYGDLDDHHIVPKDWGKDNSLGNSIDTILNRTPLTADTNRKVIRNKPPNKYLPGLIKESTEKTVRATLESHYISHFAFDILLLIRSRQMISRLSFSERQKTLPGRYRESADQGGGSDLSPELRDLDEKVERVELGIRQLIAKELNGLVSKLPQHVQQKVGERIQSNALKNAAFDLNHYQTLGGMLEFCDLRELQRIRSPTNYSGLRLKRGLRIRKHWSRSSINLLSFAMAFDTVVR